LQRMAQKAALYSFFTSRVPAPFLAVAAILPIFAICRKRLVAPQPANTTALVSSFILVVLALLPLVEPGAVTLWCLPAVVFWPQSDPNPIFKSPITIIFVFAQMTLS
jgi:hypothetical protein